MCIRDSHHTGREPRAQLEAVEIGHRDVEEHQVDVARRGDRTGGELRIRALAGDLDPPGRLEHPRQPAQRERLVVDEVHPPHRATSSGTSRVTAAPAAPSSPAGATTRAAAPY